MAAADAYLRGIERRIAAGLDSRVSSVASLFVSRWDVAVGDRVSAVLRNKLGIAIAARTYRAYRDLLVSPRWRRLEAAGAHPQRLLWASLGTKDPSASDTLYIEALSVPETISTIPEQTLLAFARHGRLNGAIVENAEAEAMLRRFADSGIDVDALANELQREGVRSFVKSWRQLMERILDKRKAFGDVDRQSVVRT
jgi:transaldolase